MMNRIDGMNRSSKIIDKAIEKNKRDSDLFTILFMKINKDREEKRIYMLWIPVFMASLILYWITDNSKRFLLVLAPILLQIVIIIVISTYKVIFQWIPWKIADKIIRKDLKVLVNYWKARKERWDNYWDLPDNI